jgi:hypothetical protein
MVQNVEDLGMHHGQPDVANGATMPAWQVRAAVEVPGSMPEADGLFLRQRAASRGHRRRSGEP